MSGDDLITPVYVPPTRPPSTTKGPGGKGGDKDNSAGKVICDDEDCLEGSGSGSEVPPTTDVGGIGTGSISTITGQ